MIANSERKFLPLSLFSEPSQDLLYLLYFKKKSRFVEEVLFCPKNELMAFSKIEMKWDWVSDVQVYIKFDAVIWFQQYCHLRTHQIIENSITDRKCVVQINSRGKWS